MKFELTSSQMNFYNKNFTLDEQIWNQGVMEIFPKVYSYKEINDAYNKLVETHDSLRVKLIETENGVVADVKDHEYINYRFWQVETEEELMKKAQDFLNEPTDRYGLLVDCAVFQTPATSGIMINAHHIVVDGYSALVMSEHINNFLKDLDFAPIIQKYPDYVEKEEKYKKSRRYKKSQEFWLKEFSNNPQRNIFPLSENTLDFSSSEVNRTIPAELFSKIKTLCNEKEITPASFFNAVNAIYLHKIYDVENFTIGVPVFNRTTADELNTIGLYMHLVPLVINVKNGSFIENAKSIEDSQMNLFRHQSFTQQDIKSLLNENNISVNQLFDVVSDFQEFTPNNDYEMRIPYGNTLSVPIEMHLQTFDEGKHNLKIRYRTAYFNENDIRIMLNSIVALVENALENPDKNICELEMVSSAEKQKILKDFNSTKVEYPRDKCLHELFEEQVERTPCKVALVATDKTVTYRELNEEANRIAHSLIAKGVGKGDIVGLMLPRKSYLLSALFGILKTGAAYLPIDMELPKERIEYMCQDTNAKLVVSEDNIYSLMETEDISNPDIDMKNGSLCYCIYTSGSTGQPKGVMARHRNVVNYISKNEHNIFGKIVKEDFETIVSISTCSFDIFVTETIATLVNGLRVVLADEQECRNQYALNRLLTREKGEFLQTTPTKLKVLTAEPSQREFLKNVKAILLGGEAMEKSYLNELKLLTDAKIYNIYGVTEVPIWSAFVDTDTFTDAITIGSGIANTQIYIVDKYLKPVPIGMTGELCIAGDSVSSGYLNRPDLTAEKFIDNPFGSGKLYKTGDHAYWREDGNIIYIGRKDFQVKIRGLRIELGEIESVLQAVEGIERAVVVVRKDKEDRQLICAFYTGKEIDAKELRTQLSTTLPKYMVPHIFTHLEKMPMTASGKANRNALPEIDLENISTDAEYVAPETKEEFLLTECIADVLDTEKVSVLDNFFDIGGDSLKSIELVSELEDQGYTINVKAIFEAKDIQSLAKELIVKTENDEKAEYSSILPATAAQMRVYTAHMMKPDATHYNINYVFKAENIDKKKFEKAINKLIERHESLRTHFETINGIIHQVIDEKASIKVEEISDGINSFIRPFALNSSPLLRVGYNKDTVVIDLHHIIIDGESMPVFFRELNELYMGRELPSTVQYGEFAVTNSYTEENEKYWLNVFNEEVNTLELPTDYARPEAQSFKGANIYTKIDNKLNENILNKCKQLGITPYAYYMACYNILLSKFSGNEDICVGVPTSGRSSKYLNTIGMFANTIALRTNTNGSKTIATLLQEIRENSISAIDNQNYPFNELVKKLKLPTSNRNPLYDVMFAYQSESMTDITLSDEKVELVPMTTTSVKSDLSFYVFPRKDDIVLMAEYSTELFKEETINKFIEAYSNILTQCLDGTKQIKDIEVLSTEEKKKILKEFNDTEYTYDIPNNTTLYSLFEKKSEENKDKVCIIANEEEIKFQDFKAYAERIDNKVRKITNDEKSVIAVICERSFEMYGAVYGIIRGGNAYLPIDPNYPQDRIDYILENSNAKSVVAQDKFCHLAGNTPCINATEVLNSTEQPEKTKILANENDTAYVIYTSGSTGNPKGAKISHKSAINRILWMHDFYPLEENDVILQKTPYTFDVSVWELFWWGITGRTLCASKPDEHFLPAKILDETNKNKVTHLHFVPSVFDLFLTYLENNPQEQSKFNSVKYVFLSGEALTANHINRFYNIYNYNKVSLHNLYGPTECAVDVSYYPCVPKDTDPVPIGKPIYNTQLHIVDKHLNPTPIGVVGELCIAGVNVGQGYLNNPDLTAEKFIDNPFGNGKMYKTGDLAYWREDGQICYVGRMDGQIKLNGQRIELGEIEKVIGETSGIESVAVIIKQNNGQDVLVAFCCGDENATNEIIKYCENKLPQYMVPSKFHFVEKMPLNQSGKLDRKALKNIEIVFDSVTVKEEPVTDTEKMLCELFQKTLEIDFVGRNESFFNLGGTSLDMISILSENELKDISAADFIANPTPEKLAEFLSEQRNDTEYLELLYSAPKKDKTLVLFPYAGGDAGVYAKLVESIKKSADNISVYFIRYLHNEDEYSMAAEEIERFLKDKKVYFYSHCVGSAMALQILNILEQNGVCKVEHYIAGASIPAEKTAKRNLWNITPNFILRNILIKAGAPLNKLSKDEVRLMLTKFRLDTDFATQYYYKTRQKITCPVTAIINPDDLFTVQYKNAEKLWSNYALDVRKAYYIDPTSHYFQSDNSNTLAKMIIEIIK